MHSFLRLTLGLLALGLIHAAGTKDCTASPDIAQAGGGEPPPTSKPAPITTAQQSFSLMVDSLATRLGAFAVLAIIAYPACQAALAIWRATAHDLPILTAELRYPVYALAMALALVTTFMGPPPYIHRHAI